MRSEGKQFALVRRTLGIAELRTHEVAGLRVLMNTCRSAEQVELALAGHRVVMRQPLRPQAALDAETAVPLARFVKEQRGGPGVRRRDEGLVALGEQFLVQHLETEGTFESGDLVIHFGARFKAARLEQGAGLAGPLKLRMRIIGQRNGPGHPLEEVSIKVQACAEVIACLFKANERKFFLCRRGAGSRGFLFMRMARQSIGCLLAADRDTGKTLVAHPGKARAIGLGIEIRVFNLTCRLVFFCAGKGRILGLLQRAQAGRFHKSGYVVIAEIALRGGHRKHDRAGRELRAASQFGAFTDAVVGAERIA